MGQILSEINAHNYGDQSSSYQKSQTILRTSHQIQGSAVSIVKAGVNGSYVLDEQALWAILQKVSGKKVAILSVVGAFREGKSFLLNFFVHYLESRANNNNAGNMEWFNSETALNKFHWNSGTDLDTHGILMWNQPFILKDENGEEKVILLMDTQGTFDHSSSLKQCTNIFALSTMLASVQIFNVSRNIQEGDLQNLELFTEFAKLARHSGDEAPFQTLLFLVRDWSNSNQYEYGFSGGQRFLDEVLGGKQEIRNRQYNSGSRSHGRTTSLIPAENMEVRTHLRSSFSELRCFLMPYPGLNVSNNNTQTKVGELEPDFKKELMLFVPSVLNDLQSKLLNGSEIDCAQFFALFKTYASVFEGERLPSPKCILQATIDASHQGALEKAKDVYNKETNVDYSKFSSVEFDKLHTGAKKTSISAFDSYPKMRNEEANKLYLKALQEYIEQRRAHLAQYIKEREKLAKEKRDQEERNSAERERLRKIAENQDREKERLRKQREDEERRAAEERRRIEEEARRQREETERQRLAREAEQRRIEQERRELEAAKRRQREDAERERREMAEARRCASQMSYSYAPSFGYSSPSYSGASSSSSSAYWDPSGGRGHSGRWRDSSTGRFTKNPYG